MTVYVLASGLNPDPWTDPKSRSTIGALEPIIGGSTFGILQGFGKGLCTSMSILSSLPSGLFVNVPPQAPGQEVLHDPGDPNTQSLRLLAPIWPYA